MRIRCSPLVSFALLLACATLPVQAQFKDGSQSTALSLPRISQAANVSQRIGLTDVAIVYHRPKVGGRAVWGAMVPYDKVWRAGANENTTVSFSEAVTIEGQPLAAGTYGLHMIPAQNGPWVVIFSKNHTSWGAFSYDKAEDALRVNVTPRASEAFEELTYLFSGVTQDSATAELHWEKLAVPFRIGTDTKEITYARIQQQLRNTGGFTWDGFNDAAKYALENNIHLDQAQKWNDQSIQAEERFENLNMRADLLEAAGKPDEAKVARQKALDKGNVFQVHAYARGLMLGGRKEEATALFRMNAKNHPDVWITHGGLARVYSAEGNFGDAVKEAGMAVDGAPEAMKPQLQGLKERLEKKEDINR